MSAVQLIPESIPLDWIQTREPRAGYTSELLLALGQSVKVRQLHGIWVLRSGKIIAGNSRVLGARLAGMTHLNGYITDTELPRGEQKLWEVVENWHRVDLTPYEKYVSLMELRELNPEWNQKRLAAEVKMSESLLVRWLSPSRVVAAAVDAFKSNAVGISDLYAMSKASEQEQHEMLRDKLGGATRDEIEEGRKQRRNGTVQVARSAKRRKRTSPARMTCPLGSGSKVVVSGVATLQQFSEALDAAQTKVKAAIEQGLDAAGFQKAG
jgi:hypothetical protein